MTKPEDGIVVLKIPGIGFDVLAEDIPANVFIKGPDELVVNFKSREHEGDIDLVICQVPDGEMVNLREAVLSKLSDDT